MGSSSVSLAVEGATFMHATCGVTVSWHLRDPCRTSHLSRAQTSLGTSPRPCFKSGRMIGRATVAESSGAARLGELVVRLQDRSFALF